MGLLNRNNSGRTWDGKESERKGIIDGPVRWHMNDTDDLVHKFPYDNLTTGTRLIVHETQQAFLFKNGALQDSFGPGGHDLTTENIPGLQKFLNLPTGGNTPFTAEVWFVNVSVEKMDMGWGDSFIIRDPMYVVPIKMFSRGQYGFKINDGMKFIKDIVGTMHDFSADEIFTRFRGEIVSHAKTVISRYMMENQLSFDLISSYTLELGNAIKSHLDEIFNNKGMTLTKFAIESLEYDDDDTNVRKVLDGLATGASEKLRMSQLGSNYAQVRQLDIMEQAAKNEGIAGAGMGAGMGMGMGFGMGNVMGNVVGNVMQTPPPPPAAEYYIARDGQSAGPYSMQQMQEGIRSNAMTKDTLVWKNGMSGWIAAGTVAELSGLFSSPPPPPPPAL